MRSLVSKFCLTLALALSLCAVRPVSAQDADTTTADAIHHQLVQSQLLQDQPITATVSGGTATLTGAVRDQASKDLATQIAQSTPGVKTVNNQLTLNQAPIAPTSNTAPDQQAPAQDDDPAAANLAPAAPGDMQNQQPPQQDQQGQAAPPQDGAAPPTNDPNYPNQNNQSANNYPPQNGPQNDQQNGQQQPPPYPNQNGPQRPYPPSPYRNVPPQQPIHVQSVAPGTPLTLPAGTALYVRVEQPIDSLHSKAGQAFRGTVAYDVVGSGGIAIPRGTVVDGTVLDARKAGAYKGGANLALGVTTLTLGGQTYNITTEPWTREGPGKGGQTAANTVGGAAVGAIIGAIAGRGPGAAIGAVAGGAAGAASTGLQHGPEVLVPPESVVTFRLQTPVTITAPSNDEIRRLARNDVPMRPAYPYPAYRRPYGYYAYPGYPPPPPPPYYYGRVYPY